MAKILVTGMSGTGKSTALEMLAARGHRAVDTDSDRWSHWVALPDGSVDWAWREPAIGDLAEVEPLLRATCTAEIDASAPIDRVVRQLEELAQTTP
ncbi:hypothetical protein [Streptosporangium sandarakinum]